MRVSVLEIYNEHLTDLLRDTSHTDSPATSSFAGNSASSGGTKLTMLETANGVVLPALLLMPLANEHEAYNVTGSDFTPELSQLNQDFYPRYKLGLILPRNCHNLARIFTPGAVRGDE